MNRQILHRVMYVVALGGALFLAGCGGGDSGGSNGGGQQTGVRITGKVSLSGSVSSKPGYKAKMLAQAPKGKPGSKLYNATKKPVSGGNSSLPGFATTDILASAAVWLYDSNHPEWLWPVSESTTDSSGNFEFSTLVNSANNGGSYTDGNEIPAGNYTLIAFKFPSTPTEIISGIPPYVAVQTIVKKFEGTVTGADLVAQPSDVAPKILTMFGVPKNTDGTNTWGGATTELAANAAIQVVFSMAMWRESITDGGTTADGISISPTVPGGYWAVSPDWTTATYYLPAGTTLTPGQTYTVTVQGGAGNTEAVVNVYGNPISATRTGSFVVAASGSDLVSPSALIIKPDQQTDVSITDPIRIASNEPLDVNGLTLEGTPSLGAKPGVFYVGKDENTPLQYKYIYEFLLGEPLKLNTPYSITVSGGKDLAGNALNSLTYSFSTVAQSTGVDATADATTQAAQSDVKDVFGKWVRSFNDRNLGQLQSLMTGNFIYEYNVVADGIDEADVNRDGRLSLAEFSDMIDNAFTFWNYCKTTVTGDVQQTVLPDGTTYYINLVGDTADFQFALTGSSQVTSSDCQGTLPDKPFYATLKNINGAWYISRVSNDVDTRQHEVVARALVAATAPTDGATIGTVDGMGVVSGIPARDAATGIVSNPINFTWNAVTGASGYIFAIANADDASIGRAFFLPNTLTSFNFPLDVDTTTSKQKKPFGSVNLDTLMGMSPTGFGILKEGEEFIWEVIALGSKVAGDFDTDNNGVYEAPNSRVGDFTQDIIGISKLKRFKNAGTEQDLAISVTANAQPLTFSELFGGYDAGSAALATITVTTPNVADALAYGGWIDVWGHSYDFQALTFTDNGNGTATAMVTLNLMQGMSWVSLSDGGELYEDFAIQTTSTARPPLVSLTTPIAGMTSSGGATSLTLDQWGYVNDGDVVSVTVAGTVDLTQLPGVTEVYIGVWGDNGAYFETYATVNGTTGAYSMQVPVYPGENWVTVAETLYWTNYAQFGLYTTTGTKWVAPVEITGVTTATKEQDFGDSSDWDASADTDNYVTVTGRMSNPGSSPSYSLDSDGGWRTGTISLNADNSFNLTIELYNGWNWLWIDDGNDRGYGLNIYTSGGFTVVKAQVSTVYDASGTMLTANSVGQYTASGCQMTVNGSGPADSSLYVYWSGDDGLDGGGWESYTVYTDGTGAFSVTTPVVGSTSGSWNYVDIYTQDWAWTGLTASTTGTCAYTTPVLTIDSVVAGGVALTPDTIGDYDAGANGTATLAGSSNTPSRGVTIEVEASSGYSDIYSVVSSTTMVNGAYGWSTMVSLYDGWNYVTFDDGYNWTSLWIWTINGVIAPTVMSATVANGTMTWDYGWGADWDMNNLSATSATINVSTVGRDGIGDFYAPDGSYGTFTISGGTGSFSVDLFDGWNTIDIYDVDFNSYTVYIQTANGLGMPQYVFITNPGPAAATPSGAVTVSGTMSDATSSGWTPTIAWGGIYDCTTDVTTYFSSDPYDQQVYGDSPLTFDGTNFSFNGMVDGSTCVWLWAEGYDENSGIWHGHEIDYDVEFGNYEYTWKPQSKQRTEKHTAMRKKGVKEKRRRQAKPRR